MKIKTCAAFAALTIPGSAAVLTWNSPSPGGIWDTTTLSWLNGASPAAWNNGTPDSAVFGTTGAGNVTLGGAVTAAGLTFNAAGYTIAGSNLTLSGTAPTITAASDAVISSILDGSAGLVKAGAGSLDLAGANTYSGDTTVSGGTLKISAPQTGTGPITENAGTLALNNGGDSAAYSLTKATSITANAGTSVDMLVALPWGWYANNNATGLSINLNGGTFKLNNKRQGSFGVTANLTGGTIDGGGTSSRWDVGRSGGFDVGINSFASPAKSLVSAGSLQLRPDSGQTVFPFNVAQGTTVDGVDLEISGNIVGPVTGTVNKLGAGTLKLTGVNTFAGPFQVSQGKLKLGAAAAFPSTPVTVAPGASFDVSDRTDFTLASGKTLIAGNAGAPQTSITGNLVAASGSTINPAGKSATGTLSLAGNLALNGTTVNVEQSAGAADMISPSGTLALNGTNTFVASAGYFPAGTYTLLSGYGSVTGTAANLAWGSAARGQTASFAVNPANVQLTLGSGAPAALTWTGTTDGIWDVNITANWNAGAEKFFQLDDVTFADSPANATVSINAVVAPSSITFTNATTAYVVRGGTGAIGGTGSITKSGAGSVALWNNANVFTGGTVINGGSIVINSGATLANGAYTPLGTGGITLNAGGTLQLNPGNGGGGVYTFPNSITLSGGTLFEDDGDNTIAGNINVTAPSVIRGQYGGKDLFLAGTLQGSGSLTISDTGGYPLYGAGALILQGDAAPYNGTITIDTGHLIAQANDALRFAKIVVETTQKNDGWGNNIGFSLGGSATNVTIAGLSGNSATAFVQNTDATTRTLTVDSAADSIFAGVVGSGTLDTGNQNRLNLVKTGSGSLTLAGSNTYTGTTAVQAGKLILQSSNSSLEYTVGNGATLGVNLVPATPTLIANTLTLGAGGTSSVNFLNFTGNTEAPAVDTLTADTDGTVTINVAGTFTPGTFPLITSAGGFGGDGIGAFMLGSLPRGIAAHLDTSDGSTVKLVVTGTNSLVWKGNVSAAWDVNTTSNWMLGAVVEKFLNGDAVLFNNTAGANTNVALNAAVTPASVTVNSASNYVISGNGSIGGTGGITKSGTGSLELGTGNDFSGDVQITQGAVKIGHATSLGTTAGGTSVADGGSLDLNGQALGAETLSLTDASLLNSSAAAASLGGTVTFSGPAAVGGAGAITLSSNLTGAGSLTKTGAGALSLSSASAGFTGELVVQSGVLNLLADRALPNSIMTTIGSGATVAVGVDNATRNGNQNTLVKSGGTLTVSDGFTTNYGSNQSGTSFLTLQGGATLGGAAPEPYWGSWTINTVDRKITVDGGAAQAAVISANGVTPDGPNPLRLAVSDVTGSAAADLVVTGSFGAEYYTAFDVEIDGGGTVEFAAANTHTGSTKVIAGKLVLTAANALAAASTLDLAAGSSVVLDFEGTQRVTALVVGGSALPDGTYGNGGTAHAAISGTGTLVVGPSDPYASWATLHGIDGAGADGDSDGDGIANGIEFILAADPSGPDSNSMGLMPSLATDATTMTFVFRCREDALEFADVEYDEDLADTWTTAVDGTGGVTIAVLEGVYANDPIDDTPVSQVTVTIPRAVAKKFARLVGNFPVGE